MAAVVDEPMDAAPVLRVADARVAYGQLAAAHRGSLIALCLGWPVPMAKLPLRICWPPCWASNVMLRSEASFNNDVGVPATLLQLGPEHEAAVVELGTNHPGELAPLVQMATPDYGVLTGIGREHLEFFGDLQGVAQEEGMLAELLPPRGKLFLYGDGDWVKPICQRTRLTLSAWALGRPMIGRWKLRGLNRAERTFQFGLLSPCGAEIISLH